MRTTLEIPGPLLEEAMKATGTSTKTKAIILSLQRMIDSQKIKKLRSLRGRLELDVDLKRTRRKRA